MTTRLLTLIALTLLAPLTAQAQAADGLGSPGEPVVPAGYGGEMRLPPAPRVSAVDPEIARLRGSASAQAPRGVDSQIQLRSAAPRLDWRADTAPETQGPSFGKSWGHAWAGFGIGSGAGGILGGVIGGVACDNDGGFGMCPLVAMLGAGMGAIAVSPLGSAIATWGFGETNGGNGNFFAALGGAYLGAGLGVGVTALLGAAGDAGWGAVLGPVVGIFATTLGSAAGYQLSSSGGSDDSTSASNDPVIVPMLAPTESGATVGVAGMF